MKKKTVGAEAVERLQNADPHQGIIDTQREADKEYLTEIHKCVDNHNDWTKPWFIVVHHKKEQLLENVIRRYFIGRQSLPTPQWDQTVWRYIPSAGDLEFCWALPDENTAKWMADNPNMVPNEQHHLYQFVMKMINQQLYDEFAQKFAKDDGYSHVEGSPYEPKIEAIQEGIKEILER